MSSHPWCIHSQALMALGAAVPCGYISRLLMLMKAVLSTMVVVREMVFAGGNCSKPA